MVTEKELDTARGVWATIIARVFDSAQEWALVQLWRDIVDPQLALDPDGYILRANAVALGLMGAKQYQMAERLYQTLIEQVDSFSANRGERRHRGALIANQAVCQILSGNFDLGVPRLQFTAQTEDWETYKSHPASSHAALLLDQLFEAPSKEIIRSWAEQPWFTATRRRLPLDEIEEVASLLGPSRWSLFAVVTRSRDVWRTHLSFPSVYSGPRLLDGLRGLGATIEHLAKTIARNSEHVDVRERVAEARILTLKPCYKYLFDRLSPPWWPSLKQLMDENLTNFTPGNATEDYREKLGVLLALDGSNLDALAPKSLAIALLTRNYSVHELELPLDFLERREETPLYVSALTHCAATLVLITHASKLVGHLSEAAVAV